MPRAHDTLTKPVTNANAVCPRGRQTSPLELGGSLPAYGPPHRVLEPDAMDIVRSGITLTSSDAGGGTPLPTRLPIIGVHLTTRADTEGRPAASGASGAGHDAPRLTSGR